MPLLPENQYYVEVGKFQYNHQEEKICGDVFLSERILEEERVVCVLSDGMGHGVKANVLATLTATIALHLSMEHTEPQRIAEMIMKALPVCSERNISYSTYTIVDVHIDTNEVYILEYDNPQVLVMRKKVPYLPDWQNVNFENSVDKRIQNVHTVLLNPKIEDRIIFFSDGISQSGLGFGLPNGWERENIVNFVSQQIESNPTISAANLAEKIVKKASANDLHTPKDDLSCAVIYFRSPRKTMLCTGPPFNMEQDAEFAKKLSSFPGRKIVSGATTSEIIARQLQRNIVDQPIVDPSLPPESKMAGVDLVTEGVLTLNKTIAILENLTNPILQINKGPADKMCKILLDSDEIYFLVGTKINESHLDPSLPVEIEIRKNVIQRLERVLSKKFLKVVKIDYM